MIKYLLLIGLLGVSLPFWLPSAMGGSMSYHFVLTSSMQGTLDPGAFVILRHSDSYEVGDVVGYRRELVGNTSSSSAFFSIMRSLLWACLALDAFALNRSTNFWW